MDAFDADVLIYASSLLHPLGVGVRKLFSQAEVDNGSQFAGVGSVLLIPELLTKPMREQALDDMSDLAALLSRLDLRPTDEATAQLATALAARYRFRAVDAVHLATAIKAGASRFITNNSKDFPTTISEIDIVYPADL